MADFEISQLSPLSAIAADDLLVAVDVSDHTTAPAGAGGSDKKITAAALLIPLQATGVAATDTPNVQAAIVLGQPLAPGNFSINATLTLDTNQVLAGSGQETILTAAGGFTGSFMVTVKTAASSVQVTVRDLQLVPSTGSVGGIFLDNTGLGFGDPQHSVRNVYVNNSGGDAFRFGANIRSCIITGCQQYGSGAYGFSFLAGCTDNFIASNLSGPSVLHGYCFNDGNNLFTGNKAFFAGFNGSNWGTAPSVPASGTPVTNTSPVDVTVVITGGTMSNVVINGVSAGSGAGTYVLPAGQAITLTYTVAPTWTWTSRAAGLYVNGTICNTITGNSFQQNGLHGIDLQGCQQITVTGNDSDSNSAGSAGGCGINTSGVTDSVVSNNSGLNNGFISPAAQLYGIQVAGTQTGLMLIGNSVTGTGGPFNYVSGFGYLVVDENQVDLSQSGSAKLPVTQMTGGLSPAVTALSQSAGLVAVDASLGNVFTLTLTASGWTISNPSNPVDDGQVIRFRLTQDATGSRTVSWGSAYDFGASTAPVLTTTASKTDIAAYEYNAALSKWMFLGAGLGF